MYCPLAPFWVRYTLAAKDTLVNQAKNSALIDHHLSQYECDLVKNIDDPVDMILALGAKRVIELVNLDILDGDIILRKGGDRISEETKTKIKEILVIRSL